MYLQNTIKLGTSLIY
ncbi:unnamed protein product [Staphylococcus haemolyticus JCSC1435]|uniref:Uncharacterized protein n=1 Tax=Staphylococcus haemolyticus (strain JCSC1435) TaxID=279808 RepID=Q4LA44_STAHJ|nr:unnamed protein product [Staphylococcus haemolyticus JCSC1435]